MSLDTKRYTLKRTASKRNFLSVIALLCFCRPASATVVYHNTTGFAFSNFIPFGPDGTPGRPIPGDRLGNQVTLAGTDRLLTTVEMFFGLNTNFGVDPTPSTDTYTVTLYRNDGVGGAPGSIIASHSVSGTNLGARVLPLVFPFSVEVPDTFMVVARSSHPTNQASTLVGVAGPFSAGGLPQTGSAVNTVWYNSNVGATTWVSNSTWAISDGAAVNYFSMTLNASPVPIVPLAFLPPVVSNGEVILNWTGTGNLEWSSILGTLWTPITPVPTPPYSEQIVPGQARFFRLRKP